MITPLYTLSVAASPNNPVGRTSKIIISSKKVNASENVEYPKATRNVSQIPIINPPITAPGMEPIPPNTAATKHFSPGSDHEYGYTVIRSVKYKIAPIPARRHPMINVMEIVLSTLIPISLDASVSLDTALIAIPILV